jgi:hypothetical protein
MHRYVSYYGLCIGTYTKPLDSDSDVRNYFEFMTSNTHTYRAEEDIVVQWNRQVGPLKIIRT